MKRAEGSGGISGASGMREACRMAGGRRPYISRLNPTFLEPRKHPHLQRTHDFPAADGRHARLIGIATVSGTSFLSSPHPNWPPLPSPPLLPITAPPRHRSSAPPRSFKTLHIRRACLEIVRSARILQPSSRFMIDALPPRSPLAQPHH